MLGDPSDILKIYIQEFLYVKLRTGEIYDGMLESYDEHINILLRKDNDFLFIKGENIVFIGQK